MLGTPAANGNAGRAYLPGLAAVHEERAWSHDATKRFTCRGVRLVAARRIWRMELRGRRRAYAPTQRGHGPERAATGRVYATTVADRAGRARFDRIDTG